MALLASSPDGRRLRSERTRQKIMEAYIELLRERPEIPTAAQIAAHAGFSTRSIFERFVDLQGLSLATVDYAFAMGEAQAVARNVDGDRPTRLQSHVETRAHTCERWLPVWRVVVANQGKLDHFFQNENKNYVPRFFAAAILGENPLAFGIEMRPLSTYTRIGGEAPAGAPDEEPPSGP